jgi:uncharacterized protein YdeI (BOF family)
MRVLSLSIATFAAVTLSAQVDTPRNVGHTGVAAEVQDPKGQDDGSWIAIRGTVKNVSDDKFVLDHGDGTITVELQPENRVKEDHKFIENEQVRVYGVVDAGFFTRTTILARAVYVESLSTYVYRSDGVDEFLQVSTPVIESGTVVQGVVKRVKDDKIVLDEGDRSITVDTSILGKDEDPKTMESAAGVSEGDIVVAVGVMDKDFWTGRTFRATSLMSMSDLEDRDGEMQGSDRDY